MSRAYEACLLKLSCGDLDLAHIASACAILKGGSGAKGRVDGDAVHLLVLATEPNGVRSVVDGVDLPFDRCIKCTVAPRIRLVLVHSHKCGHDKDEEPTPRRPRIEASIMLCERSRALPASHEKRCCLILNVLPIGRPRLSSASVRDGRRLVLPYIKVANSFEVGIYSSLVAMR